MAETPSTASTSPSARRIVDRRGRRVTLIDPVKLRILHRDDVIDRSALDRILDELEPGLARRLGWLLLAIALPIAVTAAVFTVLWAAGDANFRAAFVIVLTRQSWIFAPVLIYMTFLPLIAVRRQRRRAAEALLRHRRCPHCGYDLRELPADGVTGATTCPECACVWDLRASPVSSPTTTPATGRTPAVIIAIAATALAGLGTLAVVTYTSSRRSGGIPVATAMILVVVFAAIALVAMLVTALLRR